jgi:dCTP deaminase
MGIKSDSWIREMVKKHDMINPFSDSQVSKDIISYGLSSYGYDVRLAPEFKIFTNIFGAIIDPKNFGNELVIDRQGEFCVIPPNSVILSRTIEYFKIPRNVITLCIGKSTYARCGILVNVTPFEPEWEGYVTMELSNMTPLPVKVYANEGIAQILFFEGDDVCKVSYADRHGKYQKQTSIVLPRGGSSSK